MFFSSLMLKLKVNHVFSPFVKSGEDASHKIKDTEENKQLTAKKEAEVQEARAALYSKLEIIGNLVHDSVPVSNDEVCKVCCLFLVT